MVCSRQNIFIIRSYYDRIPVPDAAQYLCAHADDITYSNLKKPVQASGDLQCYSCWAWKQPLAIYS